MRKIRVGVVGLGSMGSNHLRVLSELEEVEVHAVCDVNQPSGLRGSWVSVSDHRELADFDLDYCVVATPTRSHESISIDLMCAGHSLLIEKPVSHDVNSAELMRRTCIEANASVAVGLIERFNGAAREAQRIIELGRFGQLLRVATRRVGPAPGREMGVGVMRDLGTHDLDLIAWMTGASFKDMHVQTLSQLRTEFEDFATITGRLTSGAIVNSELSWLSPIKERTIELLFENGLTQVNLLTGEVQTTSVIDEVIEWRTGREMMGATSSQSSSYRVKTVEPLVAQHRSLCKAVRSGDWTNLPTIEESIEILKVIESLEQ